MELERLFVTVATISLGVSYLNGISMVLSADTIESPPFRVVQSQSDFEIRLYEEIFWMSALVQETSFVNSTKHGFHRLYQYIHGANLNSTQFLMTAPVLTTVITSSSSPHGSAYIVRYYMASKNDSETTMNPPQPLPGLNLQLDKWKSHCIAVRKFGGFAAGDNVEIEKDALVSSLGKHFPGKSIQAVENKYYNYSIAQYNASKHTTGRINEVWTDISGLIVEGCPV